MLSRRDLVKLGLLGSGYILLPHDEAFARVPARFKDDPRTPFRVTPWVDPLPIPPLAVGQRGVRPDVLPDYIQRYVDTNSLRRRIAANTDFYQIRAEQRWVQFHSQMPPTAIWGYAPHDPLNPTDTSYREVLGPTIKETFGVDDDEGGGGLLVRQHNLLPEDHRGFGVPRTTVHLHGGHHPAESDGFPTDLEELDPFRFVAERGEFFDYFYPTTDPGFFDFRDGLIAKEEIETTARQSTLWYHDHLLDFTGPNAYRGLAGLVLAFDDIDTGNEEDPSPKALRLPSGPFDIPMVLQDKLFARDGSLVFNSFDHDGFIGDMQIVNGAIQPHLDVARRRYRFRFLNGANARIFQVFLTNDQGQRFPMTQIATEGGLLGHSIPNVSSFVLSPAERVEVVVDFNAEPLRGQHTLYFENRLIMDEGRKPDEVARRGYKLVQLRVGAPVYDPSLDPTPIGNNRIALRPFEPITDEELRGAVRRTFEFDRRHGAWAINGRLAEHLERPVARSKRGQGEIWRLVNKSGGWWHPIHIHSELFRVIKRKRRTPPLFEQDGVAKKDTILLRGNDEVEVFLKFRDHLGPFVFHCHNMEHEDAFMMARFDITPGDGE
jgi:FtsP/CotA-like multicopper oxidase with cupredoxin domain